MEAQLIVIKEGPTKFDVNELCKSDGGKMKLLIQEAMGQGNKILQARALILWASQSDYTHMNLEERVGLTTDALEIFSGCDLRVFKDAAIMLLVRLNPNSAEFREMMKTITNQRRSSRKMSHAGLEFDGMYDMPLAGRKEELVAMMRFSNSIRTDHKMADAILVEASSGMGKSALIRNFCTDAKASMCFVVDFHVGSCSFFEKNTPWFSFKKIIQNILKLEDGDYHDKKSGPAYDDKIKEVPSERSLTRSEATSRENENFKLIRHLTTFTHFIRFRFFIYCFVARSPSITWN